MFFSSHFVCSFIILLSVARHATSISCYECNSNEDVSTCGESLAVGHMLEPVECSHIQEAQYCIKKIGLYAGIMGTKRFCSARDYGNYCEPMERPGDERQYFACVYTCSTDGCNAAGYTKLSFSVVLVSFMLIVAVL